MAFTAGQVLTAAQLNDLDINSLTVDTNVLVVDKTNNRVGVGTASPTAELEVRGASNPEIRIIASDGSDPALYFGDNTDSVRGGFVFDTSNNDLQFRGYNNTTIMTIESDGQVGIGTTSPSQLLDVNGQVIFGAGDNITPDGTGDGHLMIDGNGYGGFVSLDGNAMWVGHNSSGRNLYLATDETVRMTIEGGGEVGIGTSTPSAKLHVNAGTVNNVATFESTDAGAIISVKDNSTTGSAYVGIRADGDNLNLRAGNSNRVQLTNDGNLYITASTKSLLALSPSTGTGNDAEWASTFGYYYLRRNSSVAAEKENITADLGEHLTADMIDSVVPKMWNRIIAPGYPEIGPIAEDMDAISPFLASRGTDAEGDPILTGINKTAYLSLLVLAVKDLRARVAALEA